MHGHHKSYFQALIQELAEEPPPPSHASGFCQDFVNFASIDGVLFDAGCMRRRSAQRLSGAECLECCVRRVG